MTPTAEISLVSLRGLHAHVNEVLAQVEMGLSPDAIFPLNLAKSIQYQETNFWVLEGPPVTHNCSAALYEVPFILLVLGDRPGSQLCPGYPRNSRGTVFAEL